MVSKELKAQDTIYVPVSVKDELPETSGKVFVLKGVSHEAVFSLPDKRFVSYSNVDITEFVTHWLKPLTNQYVFSADELRELLENAYFRGCADEYNGISTTITRDEYIKTILP